MDTNNKTDPVEALRCEAWLALRWSPVSKPNGDCWYTHTIAETPFGRFLLTWKSWKDDPGYGFDETPWGEIEYRGWNSVEDAQKWAAEEMLRRVRLCLDNTEVTNDA